MFHSGSLTNLALRKKTFQSSIYRNGSAHKAVDGNSDTNFSLGSCTHTRKSDTPYWYVDLGIERYIQHMEISNRGDCSSRLHDIEVTIASVKKDFNMLCNTFKGPGVASEIVVLNCPPQSRGRYVKIQIIEGSDNVLSLCEVKVMGL
ncbi:hypothetical protein FSP39_020805 [Pinctada imbricata]|uniref:Fucolectin tachylectin-4 pentraxin-1 domain-containing protein n=1 Tax=Pinctada imbricata TaxID=66713 RepID=A0AA88YXH0_PINIB|nr:hypothetical protein FSP39_020805 [Pinctada imbricata]